MSMYAIVTIANILILEARKENKILTKAQLRDLVYLAHGWNLALHDQALTFDFAYATRYGPRFERLEKALKAHRVLNQIVDFHHKTRRTKPIQLTERVYHLYKEHIPEHLVRGYSSPWQITRQQWQATEPVIWDGLIKAFFMNVKDEAP